MIGLNLAPRKRLRGITTMPPAVRSAVGGLVSFVPGAGNDIVSLTISGGTQFDGTFTQEAVLSSGLSLDRLAAGPDCLVLPDISGTSGVGNVLSVDAGCWIYAGDASAPTYAYQWRRDGADIPGQTSASYSQILADEGTNLTCEVTATDGNANARMAETAEFAVQAAPPLAVLASEGAATRIPASGDAISQIDIVGGAMAGSYTQDAVTFASLSETRLESGPECLVMPSISGSQGAGNDLTATPGLWIYDASAAPLVLSYQWTRAGADISGETTATYSQTALDVGAELGCRITAADSTLQFRSTTIAFDPAPILSNPVYDFDVDPPVVQFDMTEDGTVFWDYHSTTANPGVGNGEMKSGSQSVTAGTNNFSIDLADQPGTTGYLHFTMRDITLNESNTLTSPELSVAGGGYALSRVNNNATGYVVTPVGTFSNAPVAGFQGWFNFAAFANGHTIVDGIGFKLSLRSTGAVRLEIFDDTAGEFYQSQTSVSLAVGTEYHLRVGVDLPGNSLIFEIDGVDEAANMASLGANSGVLFVGNRASFLAQSGGANATSCMTADLVASIGSVPASLYGGGVPISPTTLGAVDVAISGTAADLNNDPPIHLGTAALETGSATFTDV